MGCFVESSEKPKFETFAILKAAFSSHPRTNMLISVFGEGMSLQSFGSGVMPTGEANSMDMNWLDNSLLNLARELGRKR